MDPMGGDIPIEREYLTHDISILKYVEEDDFHYKGMVRNRTAKEIQQGIKAMMKALADFAHPVYILHGADDHVCNPQGASFIHDKIRSKVKLLKLYDGMYHEIFNEMEREMVFKDVVQFMQSQEMKLL
eukprot:CAMPEP_0113937222 /NCGR_PEP_ID=MMETSP1339-20121228/3890_1 /TAXON_ID=94617 /ORGANISM="Fibrocapsa japonica" /LENGTH=127 /DNA_ID=CAMNT_0000939907 /DNA_START=24 /DNA_END=407 /DNA_ORIENTATION=- /assembly_acc=CAM_ASM_000762